MSEDASKTCEYCGVHSTDNSHGDNCRLSKKEKLETVKDLKGLDSGCANIVKAQSIKWLKKYYHPDKTTIPISAWLDFHNITQEDLLPDMRLSHQDFKNVKEDLKNG